MVFNTLCVFGTRPEAIKMIPVIKRLNQLVNVQNRVCVTGQHREMLNSVLDNFEIKPEFNLDVMTSEQNLSELTSRMLTKLNDVYHQAKPDLILVHGDTTTTLAASLSAYYHHIPVAHVEAGLRTGDIHSPWPEEINRKLTGALSNLHFAPTLTAKENLIREGVPSGSIYVTGNTVIDTLFDVIEQFNTNENLKRQYQEAFHFLTPNRLMILVTGHRRESFGEGFQRICHALVRIARLYPDIDIVYPVHLNPNVQSAVKVLLSGINNIYLIPPVDYFLFVYLMKSAYIILTDSGGIQEEAPALGKPVLVMRNITERPEAIEFGAVKLVGTNVETIVNHVGLLLTNNSVYKRMSQGKSPYGDGRAAERIASVISRLMNYPNETWLFHKYILDEMCV